MMPKYACVVNGSVTMIYDSEDFVPPVEYVRIPDGLDINFGDTCVGGIFSAKVGSPEDIKKYNKYCLWKTANDYQENWVSGAAIGIITIGVLRSKPKSIACMQWIGNIWNGVYYPQKALLDADLPYSSDFSSCGPMPYGVQELYSEVFG